MDWSKSIVQSLEWNGEISNKEQKQEIARKIAEKAKDGDVIGVGSGSTSFMAIQEIAKKMKSENLHITAIPTSKELNMICNTLGIPTTTLVDKKPDWCFDGADEVDPNNWLIKGRGAAMFREKLVMSNSEKAYILVDDSKYVSKLCEKFPLPIECFPDAVYYVKQEILKLGAIEPTIRLAIKKDGPVITENGNFIIDAKFESINSDLEKNLKNITGVIETGLFIGYNIEVIK